MDDIVVSIKDVSKVYKLYDKPIDRLKESLSITHKSYHQDHFALEGISLDVHKGECVGIIGTNDRYADRTERFRKIYAVKDYYRCIKSDNRKCYRQWENQCAS